MVNGKKKKKVPSKACTRAVRRHLVVSVLIPFSPALGQGTITDSPEKAGAGQPEGQGQCWGQLMLDGEHPGGDACPPPPSPAAGSDLHATATIPIPGEPHKWGHRQIIPELK